MKRYSNKKVLIGLAAFGLAAGGFMLWQVKSRGDLEQMDDTRNESQSREIVPKKSQTKEKHDSSQVPPTVESMAAMSMRNRLDALAAYYEKNGFAAAALLISAFNGDQEIYQATKVLALLASQKEPRAVLAYLAANDAFLLSDQDVMLSLMLASAKLFPIEEATKYAAMLPAGGSRLQAYNYLSQRMADPANSDKLSSIVANIKDPGVLSYLERYLPRALLQKHKIGDAIRQIGELERYGEFTSRSDLVEAGAFLAQKQDYTMDGLAELEALGGDKASPLLQGYIEAMVFKGQNTYELLEYTFQRYSKQEDDGALLAIVFSRALAADPDTTVAKLKSAGIGSAELNALVTRNFQNFTANHPEKAFKYISNQTDTQVRDSLLSTYGLTQSNTNTEYIRDIESRITDPDIKRAYLRDATFNIKDQEPQQLYEFIMNHESPAIKDDLINLNFMAIAVHDLDLGLTMAKSIPDAPSRRAALHSLVEVAGDNAEHIAKITSSIKALQQQENQSPPGQ